jgi:hypothetical protein
VVFRAGPGTQAARRRRGPRQHTWLDHVGETLQEWGSTPRALSAWITPYSSASSRDPPCCLSTPPRGRPGLAPHPRCGMSRCSTQPALPLKAYLCWAGACDRGTELVLQLPTNSLPLAPLTGKFGRSRRDDPNGNLRSVCPVCCVQWNRCGTGLSSPQPTRVGAMQELQDTVGPAKWHAFQQLQAEDTPCLMTVLFHCRQCRW